MEQHVLSEVFQRERGRILSTLIRWTRGFDEAEDVFQDACLEASRRWPLEGMPANGGAWLVTVAKHRFLDRQRARKRQAGLLHQLPERDLVVDSVSEDVLPDDNLRLIFTCCHPCLAPESSVALTLRTLGGLTTPEIARAFLVPESTMAQRLVRGKHKIAAAGIPYRVPTREDLPVRLDRVLQVLYLIFNEGHHASSGAQLLRVTLCEEAIRLARLVNDWLPGHPEAEGLLALMLLVHARQAARTNAKGALVTLDQQDRSLWSAGAIAEGVALVERALSRKCLGPFQLQAAIAAVHCEAPSAEHTDWRQIAQLYEELLRFDDSPVVLLNQAVAIAYAVNWQAGLELVDTITTLGHYAPFHITRAQFLKRLGRMAEARAAFHRALALTQNQAERDHLSRQIGLEGSVSIDIAPPHE
jgi:RNA polymerase sigma-70 factor, ECF subfamily